MKKLIILSTLLAIVTGFCFGKTTVLDDDLDSLEAFVVNIGGYYYNTNRFSDYSFAKESQLKSNSFAAELGFFSSAEDGFIDLVGFNTVGFGWGNINSNNQFVTKDSTAYKFTEDAKLWNIYFRNTAGLQLNLFAFSAGATVGPKFGFDRMTQNAVSVTNANYLFADNRFFLDFTVEPYVSLNIEDVIKIFFKSDIDLPIFRIRFDDYKKNNNKSDTIVKWDWFKNDVPISYMMGAAIFF